MEEACSMHWFWSKIWRSLGRSRHRWADSIKMNFKELGSESSGWILLAQDGELWRSVVRVNEPSDSVKRGWFDEMSDCYLLKKDSAPKSCFVWCEQHRQMFQATFNRYMYAAYGSQWPCGLRRGSWPVGCKTLLQRVILFDVNSIGRCFKQHLIDICMLHADHSGRAVWGVGLGRLVAGIVGSNPAQGMDVCVCIVLSSVGRGLATGWSLVRGVLPYV
jgi:hypothetical protein